MPTAEYGEFWVDKPEVEEVLDFRTGECLRRDRAIGADYEGDIKLLGALEEGIQQDRPLYACSMCMVPVYLILKRAGRKFHFPHALEDCRCSAKTRGLLSQDEINARRYNGVKESQTHINMKDWLTPRHRARPIPDKDDPLPVSTTCRR